MLNSVILSKRGLNRSGQTSSKIMTNMPCETVKLNILNSNTANMNITDHKTHQITFIYISIQTGVHENIVLKFRQFCAIVVNKLRGCEIPRIYFLFPLYSTQTLTSRNPVNSLRDWGLTFCISFWAYFANIPGLTLPIFQVLMWCSSASSCSSLHALSFSISILQSAGCGFRRTATGLKDSQAEPVDHLCISSSK